MGCWEKPINRGSKARKAHPTLWRSDQPLSIAAPADPRAVFARPQPTSFVDSGEEARTGHNQIASPTIKYLNTARLDDAAS
jgi:hypothetical protein